MALKVDYFFKETGRNLVRNPWLTAATIMVMLVTVMLVGGALMVRSGVTHATARWQGGVEFIVYMNPDATADQIQAVGNDLDQNPQVERAEFKDKDASYAEFLELFSDSPEFTQNITPDVLPTSFSVKPTRVDPTIIESLVQQYRGEAGVRDVVSATQAIRDIKSLSDFVSLGGLVVALALVVVSVVLIGNTIQTAVFARRREIEVMKLVGATNWFIRIPFMLEGIIQGLIGAGVGIALLFFGNSLIRRRVTEAQGIELVTSFLITSQDMFGIVVLLGVCAVVLAGLASAIAVTFYVKV